MVGIILAVGMLLLLIWVAIRNFLIKKNGILITAEVVDAQPKTYKAHDGNSYNMGFIHTVQFEYNNQITQAKLTTKAKYDTGSIINGFYIDKGNKKVVHLREDIASFLKISIFIVALIYGCIAIMMAELEIAQDYPNFLLGGAAVVIGYVGIAQYIDKKRANKTGSVSGADSHILLWKDYNSKVNPYLTRYDSREGKNDEEEQ